ncbi:MULTISPECIES: Hpt domain-containing protein [Marinobacter]|uniref:Hpt domain-containing protein n=1 Tax=Marinobacter xiaoshiensis TaxID=3073652 RepID=A0ABU2HER2_9GAMM|nr:MULTISPECIES: Hpt domain-containing protein [unclassified Marinobacter]MBK1872103.1 Hpt domain-containing protein [Marinobacter sp. 1-3A]MBK1885519.1 Hpt domain-containing protein [Marinobacter sp. DY40_1A1]MDS1309563.1 Hpt domain-containing protein [Marinobacter sp. F60267]
MVDKPHLDEEALAELQDVMEDEFETLINTYLSDSRDRIESLKKAISDGDAEALAHTAHSFKGSCINIGAPRLGALCREVEKAGQDGRLSDVQPVLDTIDAEFQRVTDALHTLMAGGAE